MQLQPYLDQVRAQLSTAAALGDDQARRTADLLATAAEPAVRLAVLAALTAAADEITAALLDAPGAPSVSVRMDGGEVRIDVQPGAPQDPDDAGPVGDDGDANARISLRLSEAVKNEIDRAARADSVSVNTWLVRAAVAALHHRRRGPEQRGGAGRGRGVNPNRITGWVNG